MAAHTHGTRTPWSPARPWALRSPSSERSTPTTSCPHSARQTLSRPSPQPRSSTRPRSAVSSAASRARADGCVPQMKRPGVLTYSWPHGLQGGRSTASALIRSALVLAQRFEEGPQIVGVVFLLGQDLLQEPTRRRIVVAEKAHHLGVRLDDDPLGHQVLTNHLHQPFAFDLLRMATAGGHCRGE